MSTTLEAEQEILVFKPKPVSTVEFRDELKNYKRDYVMMYVLITAIGLIIR